MEHDPQLASDDPFAWQWPGPRLWQTLLTPVSAGLAWGLGLRELTRIHRRVRAHWGDDFVNAALADLNIGVEVQGSEHIPEQGRVCVVSNHPMGGLDGLILLKVIRAVRKDARVLANHLLGRITQLKPCLVLVNPFGGEQASRANVGGLREAIRLLTEEHMLGVFPAGEVAHWNWQQRRVSESAWNPMMGRLVRRARGPVLPVFIEGRNSWLFQVLGSLDGRLRTLMLARELLNKRQWTVRVRIGPVISWERMESMGDARTLTDYLRMRTLRLGELTEQRRSAPVREMVAVSGTVQAPDQLRAEIAGLSAHERLVDAGDHVVFCAPAAQIPHTLKEIGRQREVTFRAVGEGSGNALDLDRFDEHYEHLFIWHQPTGQIVGAYRLGAVERIVQTHGIDGLYTSSLFRYQPAIANQLSDAVELGRSFVGLEYQRDYQPLMLLWKGIAQYLVRHPQYRCLFGAVSISDQYDSLSKRFLMAFLEMNCRHEQLSRLVLPRRPFRVGRQMEQQAQQWSRVAHDMEQADRIISELEGKAQGMPVLVRQYLKLNAKVLGFNVDPDFGHVLDALMYVDLLAADPRILRKMFGTKDFQMFIARHSAKDVNAQPQPV